MLNTLWLILKIILILLGIILGLVLLILLLVLFCPVRYRIRAEKTEEASFKETNAGVVVSWLFGGVSLNAVYENRALQIFLKLFFLRKDLREKETVPEEEQKSPDSTEKVSAESGGSGTETTEEPEGSAVEISPGSGGSDTEIPKEPESPMTEIAPEPESPVIEIAPEPEGAVVEGPEESADAGSEAPGESESTVVEISQTPAVREKKGIFSKLSGIVKNIGKKLSAIHKKASHTVARLQWWVDFLQDPRTQAAIGLVLDKVKFLIRHILPTRMYGRLRAGFEDPSLTGKMLAFFGMTYPLHRNNVKVTPVFENRTVIDGEVIIKGRIYLIVVAAAAVRIILSKNVRFFLKKFKNRNKEVS